MSKPVRATFTDQESGDVYVVHFNPNSFQQTVNNKLDKKGKAQQIISESVAKLTMELVFDTTDTGQNVCEQTANIAALMGGKDEVPPEVLFEWGQFSFLGMIDSFRETVDFFSDKGVPLRSTVSLGMTQQDPVFSRSSGGGAGTSAGGAGGAGDALVGGPGGGKQGAGGPTVVPNAPGQPIGKDASARGVAAANGEENLRFPSRVARVLDAGVKLGGPIAFASGGASLKASFGAGLSLGAGVGVGASFGVGAGASAGVGIGFGASASAGAGASFGASASAGAGASFGASAGAGGVFSAGAVAGASFGGGVTAGASFGGTAGAGVQISGGASAGAVFSSGAAFTAGAPFPAVRGGAATEFSVNVWAGAQASAGVPATLGAFAGLRTFAAAPAPLSPQEVSRMVKQLDTRSYVTTEASSFELGGRVRISGSTSATTLAVRSRIRFQED